MDAPAAPSAGDLVMPARLFRGWDKPDLVLVQGEVAAAQGYDTAWVSDQVSKSRAEFHVPDDAVITPAQNEGRMQVRVQFTRPISFPGYTYNYEFDYTAKSTTFLTVK